MADIDVKYVGDDMRLTVFDEDVTSDEVVGQSIMKLSTFCIEGGLDEWYEIMWQGRSAGHVRIKSKWTSGKDELKPDFPADIANVKPKLQMTDGSQAPPANVQLDPYYANQQ